VENNLIRSGLIKLRVKLFSKITKLVPFLFHVTPVIRFEGGLGSQLISAMEYQIRLEFYEGIDLDVNTEYFDHDLAAKNMAGLSFWKWELARYGIQKSSVTPQFRRMSKFNSLPTTSQLLFENRTYLSYISRNAFNLFPIDKNGLLNFRDENQISGTYSVLHIRRGDYSKIGAHMIEYDVYLNLLSQIGANLSGDFILVSDSPVPLDFLQRVESLLPNVEKVIFIDHHDQGIVHDFMRTAGMLIAANSTFSISAGILSERNCLVYVPINYYGALTREMSSNNFLTMGDFFILQK